MAKADAASSRARRASLLCVLVLAATTACEDKTPTNLVSTQTPSALRRVVGVAELTFHDLNSPAISATIRLATSIADLEQLRGNPSAGNSLASITLDLITVGEFVNAPPPGPDTRNIQATFGLNNTQTTNLVFDPARENLAFVPVQTAQTIPGSPIRVLLKPNGTTASNAQAHQVTLTELTALNEVGQIVVIDDRILQTLKEADIQTIDHVTGAQNIFAQAFVVLRPPVVSGVPASPFAGVVTFAFQLPESAQKADNPATMSVLFLIVDDTTAPRH